MLNKIQPNEISEVYKKALQQNLIDKWDSAVIFYSYDILENRLNHLKGVFPENTLHAIAIKTNSMHAILKRIVKNGFGLEAASWEELLLAKQAGLASSKAVFDSPVKRKIEIDLCIAKFENMILNANCLEELELIARNPNFRVGLRINPLIKTGAPGMFDVSTLRSKFGVPINQEEEIIQASIRYPFISGLHMHSGSEISALQNIVKAICALKNLADKINAIRQKNGIEERINFIDIGGGIPADYSDNPQPGLDSYVEKIQTSCPDIFTNYQVITEFGHFIHANTSWVISDIEYILQPSNEFSKVALIHVGADMFLRQAYSSNKKDYRLSVLDSDGEIKTNNTQKYDIAGPLCFSGDYLFYDRELPEIQKHDKFIIHDIGANTASLWSKHCNRDLPKAIAYSLKNDSLEIIQQRKSWNDILK
jgi:diaminopimelate decarboxylase